MKNVVITGGSRGIGAAAVEAFTARGDRVWFLYEKEHTAAQAVARRTGATAICCDVAEGKAVENAFRQIPDVDVLVAGHHGSKAATCEELLWAVRPEIVCISAGRNHFFSHPAPELLSRLENYGCAVYRTDLHGDILHLQAARIVTAAAVEQVDHCRASLRLSMFSYMAEK